MKQFKTITTAVLLIFLFCLTESHGFLEDTCDARLNPNNCNEDNQLRYSRAKDSRLSDALRRVSEPEQTNRVTTRRIVTNADRDARIATRRNTNEREFRQIRQVRSTGDLVNDKRMAREQREDINERRLSNRRTMERNNEAIQRRVIAPNENNRDGFRQESRITERTQRRTADDRRMTAERRTLQTRKEEASMQERRFRDTTRRENAFQRIQPTQRTSTPAVRLLQQRRHASEERTAERRTRDVRDQRPFEIFRSNRRIAERNNEISDGRIHERQTRADQERDSERKNKERRNAADTIKSDRRVAERNKDLAQRREHRRVHSEERVLERTIRRVAEKNSDDRRMSETRGRRMSDSSRVREETVRENRMPERQDNSRRSARVERRVRVTRDVTERLIDDTRAARNTRIDTNSNRRVSTSVERRSAFRNIASAARLLVERQAIRNSREANHRALERNSARNVEETTSTRQNEGRVIDTERRNKMERRVSTSVDRRSAFRNIESRGRMFIERQTIRNSREGNHRALERNSERNIEKTASTRQSERRILDTERSMERRSKMERITRQPNHNKETARFTRKSFVTRSFKTPEQERRQIRESSATINRVSQLQRNTPKDENNNDRSRKVSTRDMLETSSARFENSGRRMATSSRVVEAITKAPEYFEKSNDYWLVAAKTFLATILLAQVVANSKSKKFG